MDWELLTVAFGTVFLAELGDKTQLAAFALATGEGGFLPVFVGGSAALVLSTLIAVLFGEALGELVPRSYVQAAAGTLFVAIGLLMLSKALGQAF